MAKRSRMSKGANRRNFRRSAGTHVKNLMLSPMRGGIRL